MEKPILVWVQVSQRCRAKGLVTGMQGSKLSVSLLRPAARRIEGSRPVSRDESATLTFHSETYGKSPPIACSVRKVVRESNGHTYDIEVLDWPELAAFWTRVLPRMSGGVPRAAGQRVRPLS